MLGIILRLERTAIGANYPNPWRAVLIVPLLFLEAMKEAFPCEAAFSFERALRPF
jgi:hypothetical protein